MIMLGLTSLELRLANYALLLVGIAGFLLYERHQGAESVIVKDNRAEVMQAHKDTANANTTIADLQKQLAAISATVPDAAPMRLCIAAHSVLERTPTRSAKPAALPDSSNGASVQTGTQSGIDIGPSVQDITLSCVLGITDAQQLWNLALKESLK
jgi:hypothetical protein